MALFCFICAACGAETKRILDVAQPETPCKKCGAQAARAQRGASTSVIETIDNGWQARATHRPADAQRIFQEANAAHDLEFEQDIDEMDLEPFDP